VYNARFAQNLLHVQKDNRQAEVQKQTDHLAISDSAISSYSSFKGDKGPTDRLHRQLATLLWWVPTNFLQVDKSREWLLSKLQAYSSKPCVFLIVCSAHPSARGLYGQTVPVDLASLEAASLSAYLQRYSFT
jgi:hypothetical protein